MSFLNVGAAWSWRGQARYLAESSAQVLEWTGAAGASAATLTHCAQVLNLQDAASDLLVLTNGAQTFTAALFPIAGELFPMLVFEGDCPARDQDFWISEITNTVHQGNAEAGTDDTVIAFPSRPNQDVDDRDQWRVVAAGHAVD
ncbi:hypothetical protein RUE5091_00188 [Ruegeria denitrificans]|uniref:Uncharacterized protein n=2 Tax=Ruegeria denitrificans TaxID=1715692 RepID=A0A0P1I183_9RHOB|nr:hypothetical protein RUE5091_00188 [Ruegeria denitrificans]